MQKEIMAGVNLNLQTTQQFKTNRIEVHFLSKASVAEMAKRTLLTNILETSSHKFNTQTKVTHELSRMYGASFSTSVAKKGILHDISFSIVVVNEKFINQKVDLIQQAFQFLNEIINYPLASGNEFDQEIFSRQKANLIDYIRSAADDKQYWAMQQLRQLTYGQDSIQATPSYGKISDIEAIGNSDLFEYYRGLLSSDQIQITVVGDTDEETVTEAVKIFDFKSRNFELESVFSKLEPVSEVSIGEVHDNVNQAKLDFAYDFPVYVRDQHYFAAIVFNALFGGTPQSKLFLKVREEASLAYYASSTLDLYNGIMMVQTGIDGANWHKVEDIIALQLVALQNGDLKSEELDNVKKGLQSEYLASLDSPRSYCRKVLSDWALNSTMTDEMWLSGIKAVTIDDVKEIASLVNLRSEFILDGNLDED
ncbi:EF-P 5-aminopentanol modification-associated protein YfmF [Pediococcus argentinicus]|uniref:Peptidase M16 C-terminal domain-containing protein n=1 Tax=Pediococcus argentinicus TaxID=480391 RepID=A0A0R2NHM7_9LACO|nr:pitrilysin family protein [Pediococcus argentinicus]KRO25286.1 hypothetical protein IV88_GL000322 [Pediococcus argentinicus]NKZ22353.1 insulinase family protein [Pediococcus argentinicus]GEP19424.1 peptidase M16 [Pediococcus argentinicus]